MASETPTTVLALLPEDFRAGDSAGDVVTKGYHQVCLTGYTPERFRFVNSRGTSFGNGGFGSIPWSFLRRAEQRGFTYAYAAVDAVDDNLLPLNAIRPEREAPKSEKKNDRY